MHFLLKEQINFLLILAAVRLPTLLIVARLFASAELALLCGFMLVTTKSLS
jgi:hypothetical protein